MRRSLYSASQDSQTCLIKSAHTRCLVALLYGDANLHRVSLSPIGYLSDAPLLKDPQ